MARDAYRWVAGWARILVCVLVLVHCALPAQATDQAGDAAPSQASADVVAAAAPGAAQSAELPAPGALQPGSCARCPADYDPVCAALPGAGALRVTVRSACLAACQGLTDASPGACQQQQQQQQQPAASAAGAEDRFEAKIPPLTGACTSASAATAFAEEGFVLLGCSPALDAAAAASATAAAASAGGAAAASEPPPLRQRLTDLVRTPEQPFVLVTHRLVVDPGTGGTLYYVQGHTTTLRQMAASGAARATQGRYGGVGVGGGGGPALGARPAARAAGNRRLLQMTDNRVQVTSPATAAPYSSIGQLSFFSSGVLTRCSGSAVSPDDVLSAAHCVVNPTTGVPHTNWTFVPAQDGAAQPFGSYTNWTQVTFQSGWVGAPYNGQDGVVPGSAYLDNSVLSSAKPFCTWLAMGYTCGSKTPKALRVCGYPLDKPDGTQWCSSGTSLLMDQCDTSFDALRSETINTRAGMSGGPLMEASSNRVTGIASGAAMDPNGVPYFTVFAPLDVYTLPVIQGRSLWGTSADFCKTRSAIGSKVGNRCLDVTSAPAAGVAPVLWDCNATLAHRAQQASWQRDGLALRWAPPNNGTGTGLCLGYVSSSAAAPAQLAPCNGSGAQRWFYDRQGRLRPWNNSLKCLSNPGVSGNGAAVQVVACNDSTKPASPNISWLQR